MVVLRAALPAAVCGTDAGNGYWHVLNCGGAFVVCKDGGGYIKSVEDAVQLAGPVQIMPCRSSSAGVPRLSGPLGRHVDTYATLKVGLQAVCTRLGSADCTCCSPVGRCLAGACKHYNAYLGYRALHKTGSRLFGECHHTAEWLCSSFSPCGGLWVYCSTCVAASTQRLGVRGAVTSPLHLQ